LRNYCKITSNKWKIQNATKGRRNYNLTENSLEYLLFMATSMIEFRALLPAVYLGRNIRARNEKKLSRTSTEYVQNNLDDCHKRLEETKEQNNREK
jgi:hypothetical protein